MGAPSSSIDRKRLRRDDGFMAAHGWGRVGWAVFVAALIGLTGYMISAGWNQANPSGDLTHHQIGFLTYPVFSFFDSPVRDLQVLSYDAALLLLVFVLVIIIVGRVIISISRRNSE